MFFRASNPLDVRLELCMLHLRSPFETTTPTAGSRLTEVCLRTFLSKPLSCRLRASFVRRATSRFCYQFLFFDQALASMCWSSWTQTLSTRWTDHKVRQALRFFAWALRSKTLIALFSSLYWSHLPTLSQERPKLLMSLLNLTWALLLERHFWFAIW